MINSLILKLAIWLTLSGFYSEGLAVFNSFPKMDKIGIKEHYEYHYFRACCGFAAREKEVVIQSCGYITDSLNPHEIPRRYLLLAKRMRDETTDWKQGDLPDIIRDMNDVKNRLENVNGGKYTQKVENDIVKKLDKHIKELEDEQQKNKDGQAQYEQDSKKPKAQKPQDESKIAGGEGKGEINQKKLANYAQNWGRLPPAAREKAMQDMTRDLPKKYQVMVEDYFKALNRSDSGRK